VSLHLAATVTGLGGTGFTVVDMVLAVSLTLILYGTGGECRCFRCHLTSPYPCLGMQLSATVQQIRPVERSFLGEPLCRYEHTLIFTEVQFG